MKKITAYAIVLIIFSCFFQPIFEEIDTSLAQAQSSETIIFEYKEHGIKNSFYINESIRMSAEELEPLMPIVQSIWDKMVNALEKKDVKTAMSYFSPSVRKGFKKILSSAVENQFDEIISLLKPYSFSPNQGTSKFIQCYSEISGGGEAPEVVFEKVDGEWKIGFI